MKYSECNARQKKAFANIHHAANWIIGGLENTITDNPTGSEEYESARAQLADHAGLVTAVYDAAISEVYGEGFFGFGAEAERFLRDVRFCGKEWLMERCEARVRKLGY